MFGLVIPGGVAYTKKVRKSQAFLDNDFVIFLGVFLQLF
jgi:hypothetical protein